MRDLVIDVAPVTRWRRGMEACGQSVTPGELIRVWSRDSFRLELFDTGRTDRQGKSRLAYRFVDSRMEGRPVFEGADFCASPLHAVDSDAIVAALLGFLSLQIGDTDSEHFEDYSQRQTEWMESHAEELAGLCFEIEEALSQAREQGGSNALYIQLADDGSLDTVFEVFDCMTGEQWGERFTDVERDESSAPTAESLATIREQIEEAAGERREEALERAVVTCPGCCGVTDDQCWTCMGRGTVPAREVAS